MNNSLKKNFLSIRELKVLSLELNASSWKEKLIDIWFKWFEDEKDPSIDDLITKSWWAVKLNLIIIFSSKMIEFKKIRNLKFQFEISIWNQVDDVIYDSKLFKFFHI